MSAASPTIRVLLTEDVAADAELEVRELKRAGLRLKHLVVDGEGSFTQALREFAPDIILSDFSMPGFDGMAALALARELSPDVPFIFVSGTIGEEYAIRALKNGATDYVLKTNLVRLPAAVERALADAEQRRERRRAEARIARLSRIRDFTSSINSALVRQRERAPLATEICRVAIDIGGFGAAQIGLLDAASQEVVWLASKRRADAAFPAIRVSARADSEPGSGIAGRSLRSGRAEVWNDIVQEAGVRARDTFLTLGTRSAASFPLLIDGQPVGVFTLHAPEPGFFDRDEVLLLGELTANIAFALELIDKQERISYLARYDTLTGLPNRSAFHERLSRALELARGRQGALALSLIDLERFKAINDTLGQQTGDRVLQGVAQRLLQVTDDIQRVARLGANTFALLFPQVGGAEEVGRRVEDATRTLFRMPFQLDGKEVQLAAQAGIAVFPEDGADAAALLRNAEAALKRAKQTGERYLFYAPEINARVSEQVELEGKLRKAVEHGELFLHYQPKYDLATRKMVGLEALMRWQPAGGAGLVSPAKFVPVLEQTGLIFEAGQQVLAAARKVHEGWKRRGLAAPRIAVNVSALQLRRKSFVADVRAALGEFGADGGGVDLEVTESLLMTEVDESIRKLRELRELGIRTALDDFGTGYSSLAYLSRLPLDTVKIDRSFVHGMTEHADSTSIVSTIITLAQALRLKVVAEGVETEQQAQLLRLLRCDQVQGYLFSPPVPAEKIETLL